MSEPVFAVYSIDVDEVCTLISIILIMHFQCDPFLFFFHLCLPIHRSLSIHLSILFYIYLLSTKASPSSAMPEVVQRVVVSCNNAFVILGDELDVPQDLSMSETRVGEGVVWLLNLPYYYYGDIYLKLDHMADQVYLLCHVRDELIQTSHCGAYAKSIRKTFPSRF